MRFNDYNLIENIFKFGRVFNLYSFNVSRGLLLFWWWLCLGLYIGNATNFCIVYCEFVNEVFWWWVHWEDFWDVSERFSVSFSDHDFVILFDEFNTIFEFESYSTLIIGSHKGVVNLDSLNCLANTTDMQNSLVTIRDGCVMMKHSYKCIKIFHT